MDFIKLKTMMNAKNVKNVKNDIIRMNCNSNNFKRVLFLIILRESYK